MMPATCWTSQGLKESSKVSSKPQGYLSEERTHSLSWEVRPPLHPQAKAWPRSGRVCFHQHAMGERAGCNCSTGRSSMGRRLCILRVFALTGIWFEWPQGVEPASLCPSRIFPILSPPEQRMTTNCCQPMENHPSRTAMTLTFSLACFHHQLHLQSHGMSRSAFTGPAFTPAKDLDSTFSFPTSPGVLPSRPPEHQQILLVIISLFSLLVHYFWILRSTGLS